MDDKIVVLQMATIVKDCEILFSIAKDTFDLIQLSEIFEQSILNAADKRSTEEETVTTDLDGIGWLLMRGTMMKTQKNEQLWFVQEEARVPAGSFF